MLISNQLHVISRPVVIGSAAFVPKAHVSNAFLHSRPAWDMDMALTDIADVFCRAFFAKGPITYTGQSKPYQSPQQAAQRQAINQAIGAMMTAIWDGKPRRVTVGNLLFSYSPSQAASRRKALLLDTSKRHNQTIGAYGRNQWEAMAQAALSHLA